MKTGTRVTVRGKAGVVKAFRPGNSIDVQFDGDPFTTRHDQSHVVPVRENPGKRGGLTPGERDHLPDSAFALQGRRFPINDRRHAVIAMQYILRGFVGEGDAPVVLKAIHKKYPPTDRRNAEIWAFFEKHKAKLLQAKPAARRSKVGKSAANPKDETYNVFQEHLRAQEQGVYESLVRKELGLPHDAEFKDARGRRLDEKLPAEKKRGLLSQAIAITTRQQQRYGYLVPGTREPTPKGMARAAERLADKGHAAENRQDYERTLGSVRKSGHYRVVTEVVNGQKRYVVQPRPPEAMVQIPPYRLSEEKAREDAHRAEAAFQKAPKALKARANPYYSTAYGSTVKSFDIDDAPAFTVIQKNDTYADIAKRLGVNPPNLLVYARLEQRDASGNVTVLPPLRWFQVTMQSGSVLTPKGLRTMSLESLFYEVDADELVDPGMKGVRVVKTWEGDSIQQHLETKHGPAAFRYDTREARDADQPNVAKRRADTLAAQKQEREELAALADMERSIREEERQGASRKTVLPGTSTTPPALLSTTQLQSELQVIKGIAGWSSYIRAQKFAENVERTTRQGKGGALPREGARRAIEDTYTIIGRGILGAQADEANAFELGKKLVARAEEIESELLSTLRASKDRDAARLTYAGTGLKGDALRKKYREDKKRVEMEAADTVTANFDIERWERRGELGTQFAATDDQALGVRIGAVLLGKKGAEASDSEKLAAAVSGLARYKEAKAKIEQINEAKTRLASASPRELEELELPLDEERYSMSRADIDARLARQKAESRARLITLEQDEETAYEIVKKFNQSDEGRYAVSSSRYPLYLLAFGRTLVGRGESDADALTAANAAIDTFERAKQALEELERLRREFNEDTRPKPLRREVDEKRAESLLAATNLVAALSPRRAELEAAGAKFLAENKVATGRGLGLRVAAVRQPDNDQYKERLGRYLIGEGPLTAQSDRVPRAEAVAEANSFLVEYGKTQGLVDSLVAAEKYLTPLTREAASKKTPEEVARDSAAGALESRNTLEGSVGSALEILYKGAREIYAGLVDGRLSPEDVDLRARRENDGYPPEWHAAHAAALRQYTLRHGSAAQVRKTVMNQLAPGRVLVVFHPVPSKVNPEAFYFPRARLVAYKDDAKDFEQQLVWSLLTAKPNSQIGPNIAVFESVDAATAAIRARIESQKKAGKPANLLIARLFEAMLVQPEDAPRFPPPIPTLEEQQKLYFFAEDKDKGVNAPVFRAPTPSGQSARDFEREMTGMGGEAQSALMRRVLTAQQRDRAINVAESQLRAGTIESRESRSLEQQRSDRRAAEEMARRAVATTGMAFTASDALAEDLKRQGSMTLAMREIPAINYNRLREERRISVRAKRLNQVRESVYGPLKRPAMTPTERRQRKLPGADRPERAFYDVEYVFNPVTQEVDIRYVLYAPKVLQYITKVERSMGMTIMSEQDNYVRSRASGPERGPLATPAPPPGTYDKVTQEITDARQELADAKSKGGPMTVMRALQKLRAAFARERNYKRALLGAKSPYSLTGETIIIRGGSKVALFTDPSGAARLTPKQIAAAAEARAEASQALPVDDYLAGLEALGEGTGTTAVDPVEPETVDIHGEDLAAYEEEMRAAGEEVFTKAIATPQEAWLVDRSFRGELKRARLYDQASGKTFTADDRKKYEKYYTTNPLLAYYTIMLWNTPELFNGAVVLLPEDIKMGPGESINVIRTGDVFQDNPEHNPYKVYDELLANGVLLRGMLVQKSMTAQTAEEWREVARLYNALYGTAPAGIGDEARPYQGYVDAVNSIIKGMEPLDSAKEVFGSWDYERRRNDAYNRLETMARIIESRLDDVSISDRQKAALEVQLERVNKAKARFTALARTMRFENTELGIMFKSELLEAVLFGKKDSEEIVSAYEIAKIGVQKAIKKAKKHIEEEISSSRELPEEAQRQLQDNISLMVELANMLRAKTKVSDET